MKFVYKFETIKKIKEIFEKRVQKEVAAIELQLDEKRAEQDTILKLRLQENKRSVRLSSASELKFHKDYLASLKAELEIINGEIDALLVQKEEKIAELAQKSKEHKIFNTLEEIHLEDYRKEQDKIEMLGIDEIATQKFSREKI